jgi:WD40 repeat protein
VASPDGALLVVPGEQRTGLWDVADRYRPRRLPDVLPGGEVAAFGPDRTMLFKTRNGTYEVWDLRDPRRPRQLASVASDPARPYEFLRSAVALSRDGRTAATVDNNGAARLWDLADPTHPRMRAWLLPAVSHLGDADALLGAAAFSPRGDRLAVANAAHTVSLWDLTEDRPRRLAVLPGDTAAFTPDGRSLAVAGQRGSVRLWDVAPAGAPHPIAGFASQSDVLSLAFSNGTSLLSVGDINGSVSLWNVADLRHPVLLTDLAGRLEGGWSAAFGPHGDTLFAADHGSVRIWDLAPLLVSHPDAVTAVRLDHRGDLLATAGRDHTVRLWHVDSGRSRQLAALDVPNAVGSIAISSDDHTLMVVGNGPTQVWDITTPTHPVHAANLPETLTNESIAASPTDATVAISEQRGVTEVYDLADPYHPAVTDQLGSYAVYALAFHPNGSMLAVGHTSFTELWDLQGPVTSRTLATRPTELGSVAAFAPDGNTVALFLNGTREVQLLDIRDPRTPALLTTFHPQALVRGGSRAVGPPPVYSADGHLLAVLDGDRTVRLWDVSQPRRPVRVTAFEFDHDIRALAMSPDGRQLFTAAEENVVQHRYLDAGDVAKRICTVAYPRISEAAWREHFQHLPYQPPCP